MSDHPPLEPKPYGPDSTPAEIEAIVARVSVWGEHLLLYREVPVSSAFQVERVSRRFDELAAAWPHCDLIVDVSETLPPSAEGREHIKRLLTHPKLRRVAVFTGNSAVHAAAVRFVVGSSSIRDFSVHATFAEAQAALAARG